MYQGNPSLYQNVLNNSLFELHSIWILLQFYTENRSLHHQIYQSDIRILFDCAAQGLVFIISVSIDQILNLWINLMRINRKYKKNINTSTGTCRTKLIYLALSAPCAHWHTWGEYNFLLTWCRSAQVLKQANCWSYWHVISPRPCTSNKIAAFIHKICRWDQYNGSVSQSTDCPFR